MSIRYTTEELQQMREELNAEIDELQEDLRTVKDPIAASGTAGQVEIKQDQLTMVEAVLEERGEL